jgi:hypothetical protein
MSRYTRNTVLLALAEVTYGTDPVPTGTNAMLISKPTLNPLNAQNVPRDVILGYLGQKEHLVGSSFQECTFDVELDSGGTAGTRPAWGDLMLGCAYAETVTAATRVDYTPISTAFQSVTLYWYDDGVLHKLQGARGDVSFKMTSGTIPVLSFSFKGLYSQPTAASNATPTLTGFKPPLVVNEANSGDITLGGTHALVSAPAIVGGTPYPSKGIEFMTGNSVNYIPLLGGETVEVTQRDASCKFQLDLTAAQEVTFMTAISAATLTTLGFIHGTVAGHKSLLWLPSMQRISPSLVDENGKRMVAVEGRAVPTAGNDEVRLVLF